MSSGFRQMDYGYLLRNTLELATGQSIGAFCHFVGNGEPQALCTYKPTTPSLV